MKHTIIKKIATTLATSSLLIGTTVYAAAECETGVPVPVSGKITNNGQAPGAGFSTLGVVAMTVGKKPHLLGKMKCGIIGVSAESPTDSNPYDEFIPVAFTHTLSCDDSVDIYLGPELVQVAHSQLTLDTEGEITVAGFCNGVDPSGGIFGSFVEYSSPSAANTGRGLFTGVTEGDIIIEGTINCLGSIDMGFDGYVCLSPPQ